MRVIGGEFRSRRLTSPPGRDVRPTPDRLREALFNILAPRIHGVVFLDAYAGCGSVGIEALSRGARHAVFLEKSRGALRALQRNIESLEIQGRCEIHPGNAAPVITRFKAGVVFLDPPYPREIEYELCLGALGLDPPPLVIVQHSSKFTHHLQERYGALQRVRILSQGDNSLSFYEPRP
ncbi:MAG: 16S rRNA (guanine(966)-N(2))-methyltransferase RsmD [Bryobacterales bacterium]|nr:16S rRNA (guanine(966)-N(2))-methyltransferase RsmD [Bryobacterales bacterium]